MINFRGRTLARGPHLVTVLSSAEDDLLAVMAQTHAGRVLVIVLTGWHDGGYDLRTAYEASDVEAEIYREWERRQR